LPFPTGFTAVFGAAFCTFTGVRAAAAAGLVTAAFGSLAGFASLGAAFGVGFAGAFAALGAGFSTGAPGARCTNTNRSWSPTEWYAQISVTSMPISVHRRRVTSIAEAGT